MIPGKLTRKELVRWIAINIRRVKRVRLLTQTDIARRTGYSTMAINDITNQRAISLSLEQCVRIANALGMTMAELMSRPDDFSIEHVDERSLFWPKMRKRAQIKRTQEEKERHALMVSLGLDE